LHHKALLFSLSNKFQIGMMPVALLPPINYYSLETVMMKKLTALITLATAFISLKPLEASPKEGCYLGALGGANFVQATKRFGAEAHYNTGYAVGGFVGYEWCTGVRAEAEFSFRHNKLKSMKFAGQPFDLHGYLNTTAYMGNVLFDIPPRWNPFVCWCLTPYIGGGVGYSQQHIKICDDDIVSKGRNDGFAWQLIGGVSYEVMEWIDLALEYRFYKGHAERIYNHTVAISARHHF
jgi:opacity protein-like surface antigen